MSLDVYLVIKGQGVANVQEVIYMRREGSIVEVSREEWDTLYPGREPEMALINDVGDDTGVFSANITHNLGRMASSAGLYEYVWRPEEVEITKAGELIHALRVGIKCMENHPDVFKKFDDPNGWGTYEQFLPWLKKYLNACTQFPEAEILISR